MKAFGVAAIFLTALSSVRATAIASDVLDQVKDDFKRIEDLTKQVDDLSTISLLDRHDAAAVC